MVSNGIRTGFERSRMGLGMVSNRIRMGLGTALSRFLCGYSHRNGRGGGFYRFIGGFANIPQFLEPFPVPSIIFPLLLGSEALRWEGGGIFRHFPHIYTSDPEYLGTGWGVRDHGEPTMRADGGFSR